MTANEADQASRHAALTLALTLPGDTVLYLLLPLYAASFGIGLPEAGFLLSANRLVRIFGYRWVAKFYGERGPRAACLLASGASIVATAAYALVSGVWALLVARLLWGLAFAAMNIANQAIPTAIAEGAARRSGRARAIVAVGPMLGLGIGALLADTYGPRPVFFALAAVALLAPVFALRLPAVPEVFAQARPKISWPTPLNVWAFCMGFALDGIFVFGLSLIAAQLRPQGAVLAAGAAMALRYLSEIALSPAGGMLAQRFGARRLLIALSLGCAAALALIGLAGFAIWIGLFATVVLRALLQPLPAPVVAEAFTGTARLPALASQATWRDIGAGIGPLAAGLLFPVVPPFLIYAGAATLLAASSVLLIHHHSRRDASPEG